MRSFIELIDRHIGDGEKDIMTEARLVESQINRMRKILRKNHVRRLNEGACGVDIGLIFIDMLTSFEKNRRPLLQHRRVHLRAAVSGQAAGGRRQAAGNR
ncbi:MAG: hypothetical protein M5R36_16975 [Deltaproteobacteria bacterium]|nr:hypothetical protein [Deltaproteobacteria bacterium]